MNRRRGTGADSPRRPPRSHDFAVGLAIGLLVGILAAPPTLATASSAVTPHAPSGGGVGGPAPAVAGPVTPAPGPASLPVPSGRGTFFVTTNLPWAPNASICTGPPSLSPSCANANVSTDPSVVIEPGGAIIAAYTAYTNYSACGGNFTVSDVAVSSSSDDGGNWSTPTFLGNTQCDAVNATRFANSWEPALTALSNGTLVLAFTEWSLPWWSYQGYNPFPQLYPNDDEYPFEYAGDYNWSRIVVVRSFDGGARWTSPEVLNQSIFDPSIGSVFAPDNGSASWVDENPTIASRGDTVYLAWQNTSWEFDVNSTLPTQPATGDMGVQFARSTDGGANWSTPQSVPVIAGNDSEIAANPYLLTTPSGTVLLAYITNGTTDCDPTWPSCSFRGFYVTPVVGDSQNNGSTWNWGDLPTTLGFPESFYPIGSPWRIALAPQLAFDPLTGDVLVAYSDLYTLQICSSAGCEPGVASAVVIARSGVGNWSFHPEFVGSLLAGYNNSSGFIPSTFFDPAIAVGPNGTVYLSVGFDNQSLTAPGTYGATYTGAQQELFTWSDNNGSTFAPPVDVAPNWSFETYTPQGLHNAIVVNGTGVDLIWTNSVCQNSTSPTSNCDFQAGLPDNTSTPLEFSSLFQGAGTTLTFSETGLPAGTTWSVDVLGNVRAGPAPMNLSLSGVPTGQVEPFALSNNTTASTRYFPTTTTTSPIDVTGPLIIPVDYQIQFRVTIGSNPAFKLAMPPYTPPSGWCGVDQWDSACESLNYNVTGAFGTGWYGNGTVLTTSFVPIPIQNFTCPQTTCPFVNMTFLSWTGSGPGSASSTGLTMTVTVTGPETETANFAIDGICSYEAPGGAFVPYEVCEPSNSTFSFEEAGLPAGTTWGVDVFDLLPNQSGPYVVVGSGPTINVTDPALWQTAYYLPLTVNGSGSTIWVANGSPASPVTLPDQGTVLLSYSAEVPGHGQLPSVLQERGLPNATAWSYTIDRTGFGGTAATVLANISLGATTLNASYVYGTDGVGYYPSQIDLLRLVPGGTWTNRTGGATNLDTESSLVVVFVYAEMYNLTVFASVGGSVTPGSGWYPGNSSITLTATAASGYHFVQWSGQGPGGRNSTGSSIVVTVRAPVEEFATFEANPPVRYDVTVQIEGLPASAPVVITFNGSSFSGGGSFALPPVPAGEYDFSVAPVLANGTAATRYVPTSVSSSFPATAGGSYQISSNGTFTVEYVVDFVLTVTAGANGTAVPLGSSWQPSGSVQALVGLPAPGFEVLGWTGIGAGSADAASSWVNVTMLGPVSEVVSFSPQPRVAPPGYVLAVGESGLPSGTPWSFSVNGTGAEGTGPTLLLGGLDGTYLLTVATVAGVAPGVQYVPSLRTDVVDLADSNQTVGITFTTQYRLEVSAAVGGTAAPLGVTWVNASTEVTIAAVASPSFALRNWSGTGAGSYSGMNLTSQLSMNGPITEVASFTPAAPALVGSAGPPTTNPAIDVGVLVALLGGGFGATFALTRGRRTATRSQDPANPELP